MTPVAWRVSYDWNFGDATPHGTNSNVSHTYVAPGTDSWSVISTVQGPPLTSATNAGSILIGSPILLAATNANGLVTLFWPKTVADAVLEGSVVIGSGASWAVVTNAVAVGASTLSVALPSSGTTRFFRLRGL